MRQQYEAAERVTRLEALALVALLTLSATITAGVVYGVIRLVAHVVEALR